MGANSRLGSYSNKYGNLYTYRQLSQICILLVLSLIRDFKQITIATSTTAVVDADSRGEYVIVAHKILTLSNQCPNIDYGVSCSFAFALSERQGRRN